MGEVANICKVAVRTAQKWVDKGELKGYRIPCCEHRRVPIAELKRFMEANHVPLDELERFVETHNIPDTALEMK